MMPTDDERREVARRLRDNANQDWEWVVPWAIFNDAKEHDAPEIQQRLADLIEPNPDNIRTVSGNIGTVSGIDRDALLVLADDIHRLVDNQEIRFFHVVQVHESTLSTIERRIREAVGA